ncbi:indole-3-glycerol phosphate synthase TrpC [Prevotella sp. FD3004]|uniref:indole-3-glycerol phosphate synthase TrpC n=1 Tax=Prevotella sp. FD3004 TaxID=1408309 RepID=UPI000560BF9B|nr:indole-3-glycerol phosphate synthase TrpC [Prevotella sp. FD3004]
MADILEEIVANKRKEVEVFKQELPFALLEERVNNIKGGLSISMSANLRNSGSGIIAEFKRKSPSKGWFSKEASIKVIGKSYEENGATAMSVLTDTKYFGGSHQDLTDARMADIKLPILYKNFIIDEYQLYQARLYQANTVLLIAACLSKDECRQLIAKAHGLGLEVLLEMHTEAETEYAELEPDMCGINNRNLGTFVTDVNNSIRLAGLLPDNIVKVSESGLSNPETVKMLRGLGFRGFLMGEHFMTQPDPGAALSQFIAKLQ